MPADRLWLVAYDISHPTRLRAIARLCEDYGRRLQQSVFLCPCSREDVGRLQRAARRVMDLAADRLVVLPVCARCQDGCTQHGLATTLPGHDAALVV